MYTPLNETTASEYVRNSALMGSFFSPDEALRCQDLALGNVNLVFRISSEREPQKSVLLKQALPHSRRFPEFKMPLSRASIEAQLLKIEGELCPELVPVLYLYDDVMKLNLMEDLRRHEIMRDGLMRQERYEKFATHIGTFLAHTLFFTSDFFLASDVKKARVAQFVNPVLSKISEDLVFTCPTIPHVTNRFTPQLAPYVAALQGDETLRAEVLILKELFMTRAQALLHGDLHTGSIMVNGTETKVIDPEFAFYGPMSFDIGNVLGNLVLSFASQEYHCKDPLARGEYRRWLVECLEGVWNCFSSEFLALWQTKGTAEFYSPQFASRFVLELLHDALGMAGCEIIRRIVGLAHVPDLEAIPDSEARAVAEAVGLRVASQWLRERRTFSRIEESTALLETIISESGQVSLPLVM